RRLSSAPAADDQDRTVRRSDRATVNLLQALRREPPVEDVPDRARAFPRRQACCVSGPVPRGVRLRVEDAERAQTDHVQSASPDVGVREDSPEWASFGNRDGWGLRAG